MFRSFARRPAQLVKTIAGWLLFRSGVYRWLWRERAVIVVFHRINDALPGSLLNLTSKEFDRFVEFFARYFEVLPLTQLLKRIETGENLSNTLAITFDDGYLRNATVAAPILERHGVRACFFLATDFIGTNHVPWWDRAQQIETEWMTWDHARALRAAGHEIGSHTQTHVDLGVIPPESARREISGGEERVANELGESSGLFAYPYGSRRHMSPENQAVVAELGLKCSVSAFGGTVRAGDDPLRLKRVNITDWFISPYQFGFELLARRLEA